MGRCEENRHVKKAVSLYGCAAGQEHRGRRAQADLPDMLGSIADHRNKEARNFFFFCL